MNTNIPEKKIILNVSGLGIVFHSPKSAAHIAEGDDYFSSNYQSEQQVQAHIQNGTIVGFCTGSPGVFILNIYLGYPNDNQLHQCEFKLRLGLNCVGGCVCVRVLYELMDWRKDCAPDRIVELTDGFYHVTLCSNTPSSGILGDNQNIDIYLQKLNAFPKLAKQCIPTLCP